MVTPAPGAHAPPRKSFRAAQYALREAAILGAAERLLARVGYDAMSMDEIAAEVGIAKGSLYRHFASKERLAAEAMLRLVERARARLEALTTEVASPLARLRALATWMLRERLAGAVPILPASSPALRQALANDARHAEAAGALQARMAETIAAAKAAGELRPDLDDAFMLYSIQSRCCDPALDWPRLRGALDDDALVEQVVSACFDGLAARRP